MPRPHIPKVYVLETSWSCSRLLCLVGEPLRQLQSGVVELLTVLIQRATSGTEGWRVQHLVGKGMGLKLEIGSVQKQPGS